jgi:hypothetical protein
MLLPETMFGLSILLMALGQLGFFYQFKQLTDVALTIKGHVRGIQNTVMKPEVEGRADPVDPDEFEELRKLVFSQNHIMRALHEEIEELRKGGGGKTATKKVSPTSNSRQRRKVSKNNVFQ